MADWKIVLVVLFGLLLITVGLFTEMGMNVGGMGGKLGDSIGRAFPFDFLSTSEEGNITITGNFYIRELDLKTIPLKEIKVGYEPGYQDTDIFLSDTKLTTTPYTEIDFSGYKGTFMVNDSRLNLVGDAEETTINGVKFEIIKKLIPVSLDSVFFKNIYIKNLYMNRLEMEDVLGEITIQDRVTIKMGAEPLKLECFSGSVNITDGQFEISGTAKKVFVSGNDYTATVS